MLLEVLRSVRYSVVNPQFPRSMITHIYNFVEQAGNKLNHITAPSLLPTWDCGEGITIIIMKRWLPGCQYLVLYSVVWKLLRKSEVRMEYSVQPGLLLQ